jgi:hypothetical protein
MLANSLFFQHSLSLPFFEFFVVSHFFVVMPHPSVCIHELTRRILTLLGTSVFFPTHALQLIMSGGGDFVAEGFINCENEINILKVKKNISNGRLLKGQSPIHTVYYYNSARKLFAALTVQK